VITRKSFATALKAGTVAFLLVVLSFAAGVWGSSPGFIGFALREIAAVFRGPETQWMVFLCLGIYFASFLLLRSRAAPDFWRASNPNLWLACMLLIGVIIYAIDYSPSTQALALLGGAVLGQGVTVWAGFNANKPFPLSAFRFPLLLVSLLVILLSLASVWNVDSGHSFEYRNHTRWSGPWDNPNIAGLLMGVGAALAAGMAVRRWKMGDGKSQMGEKSRKMEVRKCAVVILFLFAAGLMARGLLHSYSRGAWVATGCGMVYFGWTLRRGNAHLTPTLSPRPLSGEGESLSCPSCVSWFNKNWLSLSAILLSVVVLSFWHFRQTEWHPAHRAFSVGNQNDFSWRNRIAAWEGDLQMMAEEPWFGFGWNQPEPIYDYYYRAPRVVESMAIQLNDYLMLAATLGIPALFCFGMYLWLSLFRNSAFSLQPLELLPATCRASAIVLLVGFWFDSGLFKLATASTFWILLELGRADWVQQKATKETKMHPIVA
jgi:hypothetical protein